MRTIFIILLCVAALSSCETIPGTPDPDTRAERRFTVSTTRVTHGGSIYTDTNNVVIISPYSNSLEGWALDVFDLPTSDDWPDWKFLTETADFDFAISVAGDSLWGTGYVTQDTLWLEYEYQRISDTSYHGSAEIHSLYEL